MTVLFPLLAGCAASGAGEKGVPRVYVYAVEPGITFDLTQGRPLDEGTLGARLAESRLIFLGEAHDEPRSHRFQMRALRSLIAAGKKVTVALEMFSPAADEALRAWSEGRLSELEFLEASGWYDTWGFPWVYYKDLFALFREQRLTLHGINATREQRRAARRGDLAPELKAELSALDLTLEPHRQYLFDVLNEVGHGNGLTRNSAEFQSYHRVQVLWDQVMGIRAARLAARIGAGETVVVLIGSGHLGYKIGANLRAARAQPGLRQLTFVDRVVDRADVDGQGYVPLAIGLADLARVYVSDPDKPAVPSLGGLKLEKDPAGVRVAGLKLFGPSPLAVFREGDVIVSLNGTRPGSAVALRLAYEALPPEGAAEVMVRRDGAPVRLTIPLDGRDG
ncbi:MAG: ChaN family lipoprotein [bacterium]